MTVQDLIELLCEFDADSEIEFRVGPFTSYCCSAREERLVTTKTVCIELE